MLAPSSCDNQISSSNTTTSKSFQQQLQCVQAGSKRSYVQAMEDTTNVEKRASNTNDGLTSAFQHPTTQSDRNDFYSGNTNNSGNNHIQLQRHRLQQQQQQQNQLGNSSRSGKTKP